MKRYAAIASILLVVMLTAALVMGCSHASSNTPDAEYQETETPDITTPTEIAKPMAPSIPTETIQPSDSITPTEPPVTIPDFVVKPGDITEILPPMIEEDDNTTETVPGPIVPIEPIAPSEPNQAPVEPQEPVAPDTGENPSTTPIKPAPEAPAPEIVPEKPAETTPPPADIRPDIVTDIVVKFYNEYDDGYNLIDGRKWCEDIAALLQKHAPEGLRISCGVAMSYTEGGSGKKGVYAKTNNCFGIRATPGFKGPVYARSDGKVYKDYATALKYGASDLFRAYYSVEDSVLDYIAHMKNNRYGKVLTIDNNKDYLEHIVNSGYCEQGMAEVWLKVIGIYDLDQYNIDWSK